MSAANTYVRARIDQSTKREPLLTDCPKFRTERMNGVNCLSRRWVA
jgi:hypothetical protein